eukprot:scaffold220442_cov34-Prasinocladus_malaysianus.AAC.1
MFKVPSALQQDEFLRAVHSTANGVHRGYWILAFFGCYSEHDVSLLDTHRPPSCSMQLPTGQ